MSPRRPLAIGAILKEEAPYLLEWIAFHRAVGVGRFFLADNGGADGMSDMLASLDAAGVVDHFPFPHRPGSPPQLPAYAEILRRHGGDADWIAFIDADEFLTPRDPEEPIDAMLAKLGNDVGRAIVNWATFGSSFHAKATEGLVIERFNWRARRRCAPNRHYKSIVRPRAVAALCNNPHAFELKDGYVARRICGAAYDEARPEAKGKSGNVVWSAARLNHYAVKSRDEFVSRKVPKGRADVANRRRNEAYFATFDRNEIEEPMAASLRERTRIGIESLKEALRAGGFRADPPPP